MGSTSSFKTCFNVVNSLIGLGMLYVPFALSSGGWLSLLLLLAIATVSFYTSLLLIRCMDAGHPKVESYPDVGDRAFGKKGRMIVTFFMCAELYLAATCSLILEGDNLHNLFPNTGFVIWGLPIHGNQLFTLLVALLVLPSVCLNSLTLLSYVSATGVFNSFVILASILWTGAFEGVGFHHKATTNLNWKGFPTATGLYTFCYGTGHTIFPMLYSSMKKKHQFSYVLIVCFIFCTITYGAMAVTGYLMFGSDVQSQITLNLPIEKLSSKIAIYTTLINPLFRYALTVTPVVNAIETWIPCVDHKKKPLSLLVRTALVLSTMIVALTLPFFGSLMSLVGAFLTVTVSILLPCLCYLKISGIYKEFGVELVIIVGILLMGISAGVMGTYTSVLEIIRKV